ncbi:MAG TPA: hypothetical protein VHE55_06580 [Fimbriimonadaceae bacterium]|nr:hypothetical protein [Fimbriimonadaceae bacterium]
MKVLLSVVALALFGVALWLAWANWDSLADPVAFAAGTVSGLVLVLVAVVLWAAVAGPIQELLCELLLDPLHRLRKPAQACPKREAKYANPGELIVLVSDIHLDTWRDFPDKAAAFVDFLSYVKSRRVGELYVNGDLLDIPPHPLNQKDVRTLTVDYAGAPRYPDDDPQNSLGVLLPPYDPTFDAINRIIDNSLNPPATAITYLTGNHDIGAEGLRFIRPDLSWNSIRVAWNPAVVLKRRADRWVYVEHGHRYDPFIWLYLQYAVLQLLRGPGDVQAIQRFGKTGHNAPLAKGEAPAPAADHCWEWMDELGRPKDYPKDAKPEPASFGSFLAKYRFRQSARRLYRRLWWQGERNIRVVTFGHTHIPDRYEFPYGHVYVNSGDWAGGDHHQCYVLIEADGTVTGPHQWRGPKSAMF